MTESRRALYLVLFLGLVLPRLFVGGLSCFLYLHFGGGFFLEFAPWLFFLVR